MPDRALLATGSEVRMEGAKMKLMGLLIILVCFCACQAGPVEVQRVKVTKQVTVIKEVAAPTAMPTWTPQPTHTPYPTNTPYPTATPVPSPTCTRTPRPTATVAPTSTPSPTPSLIPTETPTSIPTPALPVGWTTYESLDRSFSMGYGPNWEIHTECRGFVVFTLPDRILGLPTVALGITYGDLASINVSINVRQEEAEILDDMVLFWADNYQKRKQTFVLKESGKWIDEVYTGYYIEFVTVIPTDYEIPTYHTIMIIPTQDNEGFMVMHARLQARSVSPSDRELVRQVCNTLRVGTPRER